MLISRVINRMIEESSDADQSLRDRQFALDALELKFKS